MQLIILDRDGVINQPKSTPIKSPDEWEAIPGSLEAIARLNQAGYRILVVMNQSGLARGYLTLDDLHYVHAKMYRELAAAGGVIEAIFFCPHNTQDNCQCRKPRPGLLQTIANRLGISLMGVPVVGDSLRDLQAAIAVGASPILVRTGKGERTLADLEGFGDVAIYEDLRDFAEGWLNTHIAVGVERTKLGK